MANRTIGVTYPKQNVKEPTVQKSTPKPIPSKEKENK